MLNVGDITWRAENVAFYIKRMHQLQKKVENAILDLDKEATGTPYDVTDKFGVEDPNLLDAIDQIAHANNEKTLSVAADHLAHLDKFRTHNRHSAQRANLANISLALDWYSLDALVVLYCLLDEHEEKGDSTIYYRLKDLEEVTLEILNHCEKAYITSEAPVPTLAPDLGSKLKSVLQRGQSA
jgi:hypothetical protein